MNETLKIKLDAIENEKAKIRKAWSKTADILENLKSEINVIYNQEPGIFSRSEETREKIKEMHKKESSLQAKINAYKIAINCLSEMKVKAAAETLINDILQNPEKWEKYPIHYKKFDALLSDLIGPDFYIYSRYGVGSYDLSCRDIDSNYNYFIFYSNNSVIDEKTVADMKNKINSFIDTDPRSVLKTVKKAQKTHEKMEKEIKDFNEKMRKMKSDSAENFSAIYYTFDDLKTLF